MSGDPLIFVVDDDDAVRDSLAFLLESAHLQARTFADPVEALQAVDASVRCLVTDVRMPQMSGLDLVERLKAAHPALPIVVITGHADVPMAVEAMKRGAGDFIEKPFDDESLLRSIRQAMRPVDVRRVDPQSAQRLDGLSVRERQVLEGLMTGRSNKEIARDLEISPRTVEIYRAKVMAKTGAETYADLIRLGLKAGLGQI